MSSGTTGKDLLEFWKYVDDKGLVNHNTALGFKSAVAQVSKSIDDWDTLDIATTDVDSIIARFQNKSRGVFKPASLMTYRRRFETAVADFLKYVENPHLWKPSVSQRAASDKRDSATPIKN